MHTTILLDTDSYKGSHWLQVPSDCTAMGAYLESRGGEVNETLFFGLQMILQTSLERPISQAELEEAAEIWALHGLPFNRQGWQRVVQVHGGRLPLRIRAVPEGLRVPTGHVLMTVESTDPELAWLVTWVETVLLRVWYPTTVATRSWQLRRLLEAALERSADDPAAEHSTILAWGQEQEAEAYRTILERFARPGAVLAVVSDSYDLWHAVDHLWGEQLRPQVIASGATVVIRPDSGEPQRIVPELLHRLEARFGSTVNGKGYRVLEHVRVIQGDGITVQSLPPVLEAVLAAGFSAENVAYGMGGGLLQQLHRDTLQFAYKVSWVERRGRILPVHKAPRTDPRKTSKAGVLDLVHRDGHFRTVVRPAAGAYPDSCLQTVWENGTWRRRWSLEEVRAVALQGLP